MSKIELNNKQQDDNVFPEGLVRLYQDFGTHGVTMWIENYNLKQVD